MAEIQSATTALSSATPASAAASSLTPVQANITTVPQALASLDRTIQINATPAALSASNELTLITALGNVTVTLALQVIAAEKQIFLQQLLAITEAQKPLTLSLQPGTPPTQAVLLIPNAPVSSAAPLQNSAAQPISNAAVPPLTVGETLSAIVLPSLPQQQMSPASLLQSQPLTLQVPGIEFPAAAPLSVQFDVARTLPQTALPVAPQVVQTSPVSQPVSTTTPVLPLPNFIPVPVTEAPEIPLPPVSVIPTSLPQIQAGPISAPQTISAIQTQSPIQQPLPAFQVPGANYTSAPVTMNPLPQQSPPPLVALLQPGNTVIIRVDAVILPPVQNTASSVLPPLPALAPNQIAATVIGTGTDGQLILKAGDTTLFVKTPAAAPVGSTIILTVDAAKPEQLLVLPQNNSAAFPSLPQAVAALAQNDPQMLAQMMATRLPQPTEYLPGALLFLFSAFKQGNVGTWLGENATDSLMRMGKADIVANLSRELSSAGQIVQDPVVGEWRTYPIPLYSGQQFQAVTLYVHSDRDARKDQPTTAQSCGKIRFLIDMRLSKLGAMQIDGFVQPKKLDIVLRSEAMLPEGLHNELRTSYIDAVSAVGFTGTLNFQVGKQYWMKMQKIAAQGIIA